MTAGYGLKFHHFGLAVERPQQALRFLSGLGYNTSAVVYDPEQNVNLIWGQNETMPAIEIIFPAKTPGPLEEILKRGKHLIYHICYVTKDLDNSLKEMRSEGHRILCVAPPKSAVLFRGKPVGFYFVSGFGLIEIIEDESDKSAASC